MHGSRERVFKAFRHELPDRTPLFELYWPYRPVHWEVCGQTVATDMRLAWDAMADGIAWEELVEAEAQCDVRMARHFGLDMMHVKGSPPRHYARPCKTGHETWELGGVSYAWNERTKLIEPQGVYSGNWEDASRGEEAFTAAVNSPEFERVEIDPAVFARLERVQELLRAAGDDIVVMAEVGNGSGAAFYPPLSTAAFSAWAHWVRPSANAIDVPVLPGSLGRLPVARRARGRGRVRAPQTTLIRLQPRVRGVRQWHAARRSPYRSAQRRLSAHCSPRAWP
jgi:hypothetical protein